MKQKKCFVSPRVVQEVQIQLEKDLLAGSVQDVLTLRSMGIEVEHYDFSEVDGNTFTVDWEDE